MSKVKSLITFSLIFSLLIGSLVNNSLNVSAATGNDSSINYIPIEVKEYRKEPSFISQLSEAEKAEIIKEMELLDEAMKYPKLLESKEIDVGGVYYDEIEGKIVIKIINEKQKQLIQNIGIRGEKIKYEYAKFSLSELNKYRNSLSELLGSQKIQGLHGNWIDIKPKFRKYRSLKT